MKKIPLFRATSGLNTVKAPGELVHDPEHGRVELSRAINVDISDSGTRITRRKGTTFLTAGSFHSGFCAGGDILCVQEHPAWSSLYRFNPSDRTLTGVRSGLTQNRRMAYCQVGGLTYYSNGVENGIYEDGVSRPWVKGEYVGHENFKELFDPPVGDHLEVIGGYMLIAEGPNLWVSEEFDSSAYNLANRRFTFEEPITMVKAVGDGVWIGTEKRTCFLSGTEPEKWSVTRDIPYGILSGSVTQQPVSATRLSLEGIDGEGFLWMSTRGVCWGGPGGTHVNLTERSLTPASLSGKFGTALKCMGKVVFTIES
jgi:hypothetical protein